MTWEAWAWTGWGMAFGILETYGLMRGPGGITLTRFVELHIPKFVIAGALGWAYYHFLIAPLAKR